MSKPVSEKAVQEFIQTFGARMSEVAAERRITADSVVNCRVDLACIAALMVAVGEPEQTRATLREAATMFNALADVLEGRH